MLILILIDVHYLQNNVFSFKKCSKSQNHSSGSHHSDKKIPLSLHPFTPFGKPYHIPNFEVRPMFSTPVSNPHR